MRKNATGQACRGIREEKGLGRERNNKQVENLGNGMNFKSLKNNQCPAQAGSAFGRMSSPAAWPWG